MDSELKAKKLTVSITLISAFPMSWKAMGRYLYAWQKRLLLLIAWVKVFTVGIIKWWDRFQYVKEEELDLSLAWVPKKKVSVVKIPKAVSVRFVPSTFTLQSPDMHCAFAVHPKTSSIYSGAAKSHIWGLKWSEFPQRVPRAMSYVVWMGVA